jgi:FAD:protein FMN transferase
MNAVAQGYSVDVICRLLDGYNIKNYLVEIGGEVRAKGARGDRLWRVGLDKPIDNNNSPGEDLFAVVELEICRSLHQGTIVNSTSMSQELNILIL